jgi:hypothetical protein
LLDEGGDRPSYKIDETDLNLPDCLTKGLSLLT